MNSEKLSQWLHRDVPVHYKAKVGDEVEVTLPRIPMTAETQMLAVMPEIPDASKCLQPAAKRSAGEGRVGAGFLVTKAVQPGRGEVIVSMRDAISGKCIAGVEPLRIVIDVEE